MLSLHLSSVAAPQRAADTAVVDLQPGALGPRTGTMLEIMTSAKKDISWYSPHHVAVCWGRPRALSALLLARPTGSADRDRSDYTPAHRSVWSSHILSSIIVYPEGITTSCAWPRAKCQGMPTVHVPDTDALPIVRLLFQAYPRAFNDPSFRCGTPAHHAVSNGSFEMVKLLLELCPRAFDTRDGDGYTPIQLAFVCLKPPQRKEKLQLLLEKHRSGFSLPYRHGGITQLLQLADKESQAMLKAAGWPE